MLHTTAAQRVNQTWTLTIEKYQLMTTKYIRLSLEFCVIVPSIEQLNYKNLWQQKNIYVNGIHYTNPKQLTSEFVSYVMIDIIMNVEEILNY